MDYADTKWQDYLIEEFGQEIAQKLKVQSHAASKTHDAKIIYPDFDENKQLIEKIQNHPNITSAYIIKNKVVTEIPTKGNSENQ